MTARGEEAYKSSKRSAGEKQIKEVCKKAQDNNHINVFLAIVLDRIEKNYWCGIINNTFTENQAIKQGYFILIKHLLCKKTIDNQNELHLKGKVSICTTGQQ